MLIKAYETNNFYLFEYIKKELTHIKYPEYIKWKKTNKTLI